MLRETSDRRRHSETYSVSYNSLLTNTPVPSDLASSQNSELIFRPKLQPSPIMSGQNRFPLSSSIPEHSFQHKFVPWIVVNGVSLTSLQGFQNQLPTLLCEWYSGDKPIPFCEAALKLKYKKASVRHFF